MSGRVDETIRRIIQDPNALDPAEGEIYRSSAIVVGEANDRLFLTPTSGTFTVVLEDENGWNIFEPEHVDRLQLLDLLSEDPERIVADMSAIKELLGESVYFEVLRDGQIAFCYYAARHAVAVKEGDQKAAHLMYGEMLLRLSNFLYGETIELIFVESD